MNAVATAGGIALLPVALGALAVKREWRVGLRERFGALAPTPPDRDAIWIHGASVGELTALAPVVGALRTELPDHRLLVSSMTVGGRLAAATRVPDADDRVLFPLDLPTIVAAALDRVRPRLVLFSETELWPNFLVAVAARGIPAIMVSGRVSPAAFARYTRWRWLFVPALIGVRWFCVQTLESARRLVALGAPAARIVVTGSLKTVGAVPASGLTLARLGVGDRPVLVAASTHPGEDEPLLDAFVRIRARAPAARLVLAPRKLDRIPEVVALATARGLATARRSTLGSPAAAPWPPDLDVLVLDTLGELAGCFAGARLAFVGGTLVPVGGHNVLEPAAAGTAVAFGPHVENVRADAERLHAAGAALAATSADDLVARLPDFFLDAEQAGAAGRAARALLATQQGPLAVTLAVVRGTLAATRRHA